MTGSDEARALEALGYTEEWLTSGVLDRELLAAQLARLEAGGTGKTERYRSQAVTAWCERSGPIADDQLDAFLALMAAEPDARVSQAGIVELIRSPRITLDQLGRIAGSDPKLMRRHEKLIRRTYLGRRLAEEVTDDLVSQVIEFQDASIQTGLIRDARLSRRQAEMLARRGANPTIRANAEAWLQDKKAWRTG